MAPWLRECTICGERRRCSFTGIRWVCRPGCWDSMFPREDDAA